MTVTVIDSSDPPLSELDPDAPTGRVFGCIVWILTFAGLLAGAVFAPSDVISAICWLLAVGQLSATIVSLILDGDR